MNCSLEKRVPIHEGSWIGPIQWEVSWDWTRVSKGTCKTREVRGLMRGKWLGVASLLSWMKIHCKRNFGGAETDQPRWSSWCGAYRWCWPEVVRGGVATIQMSVPKLSHLFEEVMRIENIDWARILKVKNTSKNAYRWYDHLGRTLYTIPSALQSVSQQHGW